MPSLIHALVWLSLLMSGSGRIVVPEQAADPELFLRARCLGFTDLGRARRSRLANPVLRTPLEVREAVLESRGLLECLESVEWTYGQPDWLPSVIYHLNLFLVFADAVSDEAAAGTQSTDRVDFGRISDPAIQQLREALGLAPPEGFIFVRYFSSRAEMPPLIRVAFRNTETRAVTMGARYVAVLLPEPSDSSQDAISEKAFAATFSHELVHAFLNARLDWGPDQTGFPSWFHEGMAIHFSDSDRRHVTLNPLTGQMLRIEPTVEYGQYARVFRYLESELGQDGFSSVLRASIENVDASLVLDAAGVTSYEELHLRAERWWRWWPVPVEWTSGPGVAYLVAVAVVASAGGWVIWRRWQPAVRGSALEMQLNRDLFAAVRSGDRREVLDLVRSGANVNAIDSGHPVLAWAVWLDDVAVAEALVQSGASVTREILQLADMRSDSGTMVRVLTDAALRHENFDA